MGKGHPVPTMLLRFILNSVRDGGLPLRQTYAENGAIRGDFRRGPCYRPTRGERVSGGRGASSSAGNRAVDPLGVLLAPARGRAKTALAAARLLVTRQPCSAG